MSQARVLSVDDALAVAAENELGHALRVFCDADDLQRHHNHPHPVEGVHLPLAATGNLCGRAFSRRLRSLQNRPGRKEDAVVVVTIFEALYNF
eukprot:7068815-Prymnesium_polylepis.1